MKTIQSIQEACDYAVQKIVWQGGRCVDVLLDHVIVAGDQTYSFAEHGRV